MSPVYEIVNYKVGKPPQMLQDVVKNLIFMRKHKEITIERPRLDFSVSDKSWYDPDKMRSSLNFFKTEEEENQQKLRTSKVLLQRSLNDNQIYHSQSQSLYQTLIKFQPHYQFTLQIDSLQSPSKIRIPMRILKKKLIKKAISSTINKQKEIEIQKKYCKYLLNSLHKSNLMLISKGIPPNLSVLETIDDGDYLKQQQRKEFPHYSNVLQPIDLPPITQQKVRIIRQPVRFDPRQHCFTIQQNTIFKVKHIYIFLQKLFQQSITICETIREMNFRGDQSLKLQNENHNFERLAVMTGVNYRVAKLLYDMLNDHYDLEKELALGRCDDYKLRVCKELVGLARNQVKEFFQKKRKTQTMNLLYSCYTPIQEYYLSLRDLRDIFLEVHNKPK